MVRKIANGSLVRGLDFERRSDPGAQPQPAGMDQQKHRGGIGGGDHRADQERFHPVEAEQEMRDRRRQCGGEQDADGGEHEGRRDHAAERREPRAQTAVEQDQRQRHRTDQIGRVDVVELHAAGTGFAGEHADQRETPAATARRTAAQPGSTGCLPAPAAHPA